jgi:hypothetical protein
LRLPLPQAESGRENLFERRTAVEKPYHTMTKKDIQGLARFLVRNGQALLPMVELIE